MPSDINDVPVLLQELLPLHRSHELNEVMVLLIMAEEGGTNARSPWYRKTLEKYIFHLIPQISQISHIKCSIQNAEEISIHSNS